MRPLHPSPRITLVALGVGALGGVLSAQQDMRAVPAALTGTFGSTNWEAANNRGDWTAQWWYRGDAVGRTPMTITAIAGRRGQIASQAIEYDLEVVFDNSARRSSDLKQSAGLKANLSGKQTVVFKKRRIKTPAWSAAKTPNDHFRFLMLDRPFVFTGPNLLMHTTWTNWKQTTPPQSTFTDGLTMNGGIARHLRSARKACGAQHGAYTSFGAQAHHHVTLLGGPSNAAIVFMVGFDNTAFGPARLPLDLSPLGMTGCELQVAPVFFFAATTDRTGYADAQVFPFSGSMETVVVHSQVLHPTTLNTAGLATSNLVTSFLGRAGYANMLLEVRAPNQKPTYWGPHAENHAVSLLIK